MDRLIEGYREFRATTWPKERTRYEKLAEAGQKPETLVIACSDSRVDPQTVFGAGPGELFVVRNVAGLVPRYKPDANYHGTSAALEFGVRVLKVGRIVVLGHARCGGVQTLVEGAPAEARDFVEPWMGIAREALRSRPAPPSSVDKQTHYETEVVRITLENLLSFPWINDAVKSGTLELHGFRFDVSTGVLGLLEEDHFVSVE
jgi:carbonic anhydrase